jgi:hypothetical protein
MFEELLSRIGPCLTKHTFPYMVIGGQAVLLYGEPRLTRDIDVTLGANIDRVHQLLSAIQEISLEPIPKDIESFVRQTMVLPALETSTGIRVDFIFSFTPYETEAIKRAKKVEILGREICFASSEDVVIHKIFAGRQRDKEDARIILLKNPSIDISYIRTWLMQFDASSEEHTFLKTFEEVLRETRQV